MHFIQDYLLIDKIIKGKNADAAWNRGKEEPLLAGPLRRARKKAEHNSALFPGHSWRGGSLPSTAQCEGSGALGDPTSTRTCMEEHGSTPSKGRSEAWADLREGGDVELRATLSKKSKNLHKRTNTVSPQPPTAAHRAGHQCSPSSKREATGTRCLPEAAKHPLKPCRFPAPNRPQHLAGATRLLSLHLSAALPGRKAACLLCFPHPHSHSQQTGSNLHRITDWSG